MAFSPRPPFFPFLVTFWEDESFGRDGSSPPLLSTRAGQREVYSGSPLRICPCPEWLVGVSYPQSAGTRGGSRANGLLCFHELIFLKIEGCCFSFSTMEPAPEYPNNEDHIWEHGEFILSLSHTKIKIILKCQRSRTQNHYRRICFSFKNNLL